MANVESDLRNVGAAYDVCFAETTTATDCASDTDLDPFGFNPSEDVTLSYDVSDDGTITGQHDTNEDVDVLVLIGCEESGERGPAEEQREPSPGRSR